MAKFERSAILKKFRNMAAKGEPIVGGGAGTGLSAKCEEAGGVDLIVIYNSGRYRMAGRGSLAGLMPYGNANQVVREMAHEVLTAVRHTPILAGVCGTDPFMLRDHFLTELQQLGFAGIQNFPTVGLIVGARTAKTLEQCVREVTAIAEACRGTRSDCLVLCHGGPIAQPEDAQYMLERSPVDGFYGGSSMERLPAEIAITAQVRQFVELR